jgi:hypothetical protein
MEAPTEYFQDGRFRNTFEMVHRLPEITHVEVAEYFTIGYNSESDYYSYMTEMKVFIVDSVFVKDLINFTWYRMKTNHGSYSLGKPRTEKGKEFLQRIGRDNIEMHTLLALVAGIPNPNSLLYVDHVTHSRDNRIANLTWSDTKPYRQLHGEDIRYPDGHVGDERIKYHIASELGPNGEVIHKPFFKVSHRSLRSKSWFTSRSPKMTNQQKLEQAKKKLKELDDVDKVLPGMIALDVLWDRMIELMDEYNDVSL